MNNTATRMIRSEEITIDMRICTILAGGKKPGEVYFAAIAPDMELTVINPFAYVHSEKDILKLVITLMTNTKGEGSGGDPFWEKSERLLLTALIAYLHYEAPVEEQNFATLLEMLNTMQVLEDDEEYQNPVDLLFEELAKKKPNSFAGRQYKLYKLAAGDICSK